MGKPTGFIEFSRELPKKRPPQERIKDWKEFALPYPPENVRAQASRCMDCGVPTCHAGCPLGNLIPDWNDLVYRGHWQNALRELHSTNNFPEFTGRLCPAPCEEACVLSINQPAVTIEEIEKQIVERGFQEGWIQPEPPAVRTGKKVAVIGSGPAGLACAQQLNRAGHHVTVFERDAKIGGLLRYGIPDFKMEKWVIDRRLDVMRAEGIEFRAGVHVGREVTGEHLRRDFDAVVLCTGATRPRDLPIPGRDLDGVHFAMDFLSQQNRRIGEESWNHAPPILAAGKNVLVIGGGDTGSDCIGTSHRQGAASVTNFELLPRPPEGRASDQPWPLWPVRLRTSSSHEEGCDRYWSLLTKEFIGEGGVLKGLRTVELEWVPGPNAGRPVMQEKPGTEKDWKADLVLLALGFLGCEADSVVQQLGVEPDERGNLRTKTGYQTSVPTVFAAGDGRRGQSLIVWAISEGREAAREVDLQLMGASLLPTKGSGDLPRA